MRQPVGRGGPLQVTDSTNRAAHSTKVLLNTRNYTVIVPCSGHLALTYARYALRRTGMWRDPMNVQDMRKRTDWLMRLAQMASITVGIIILTEFIARHWRAIAAALGLGS